jgi:hypothetical protein
MSDYILNVNVEKLSPHPINETIYDFNSNQHQELKRSIELNGLLEPLTIDNKYQVYSGHRRLNVIKELGWIDVSCRLTNVINPIISLIEHNRYRKKTATELLRESDLLKKEYSKDIKQGQRNDINGKGKSWTILNVSKSLGVSTTKLKQLKSIKHYEPSLLFEIDMGKISVGKAYQQIRKKYILNGNGGRPLNKFEDDFNNLMLKYKPSTKELNHIVKKYNQTLGQK